MPGPSLRQRLYTLGCRISDRGANLAGHPTALIGTLVVCTACFVLLGDAVTGILTLVLSVLAITLTQMVLNQQKRHELALHMKIDELIHGLKGARDDYMGIEHKTELELEALHRKGDQAEQELAERRAARQVSTAGD